MSLPRVRIGMVALAVILLAACDVETRAIGPTRDEPIEIGGDGVERANVELDMGAGEMTLRGGASKILQGHFEYNVDAWKPLVKSSINGSDATITIRQPEHVR